MGLSQLVAKHNQSITLLSLYTPQNEPRFSSLLRVAEIAGEGEPLHTFDVQPCIRQITVSGPAALLGEYKKTKNKETSVLPIAAYVNAGSLLSCQIKIRFGILWIWKNRPF